MPRTFPARQLDRREQAAAAHWLGDRPQTVVAVHGLLTGRCDAWSIGDADQPRALLVRTHFIPSEPYAFGRDPDAIAKLLFALPKWNCVNVGEALMQTLPPVLERRLGRTLKKIGDLYHVLLQVGPKFEHPAVRMLNLGDVDLLATAAAPVGAADRATASLFLHEGLCAAAVVDGRIVARAQVYCRTIRHAEIGVATDPAYRNRGLVSACSSMLIDDLLRRKLTPVWSTGDDNPASQHVAAKLGFVRTTPRLYLSLH